MASERKTLKRREAVIARIGRMYARAGWKKIESRGCFAALVMKSPDGKRVIKASTGYETGRSFDTRLERGECDGWPAFIRWAATAKSPHLPKLHKVRTLHCGATVAVMEHLRPSSYAKGRAEDTTDALKYSYNMTDLREKAARLPAKLITLVERMSASLGWPGDLHAGNIMLRQGKLAQTVVITDPYGFV